MRLDIYVNYRGTCEQAFRFYEEHLGGKVTGMVRHGEQPNPSIPADWKEKVLGRCVPCNCCRHRSGARDPRICRRIALPGAASARERAARAAGLPVVGTRSCAGLATLGANWLIAEADPALGALLADRMASSSFTARSPMS